MRLHTFAAVDRLWRGMNHIVSRAVPARHAPLIVAVSLAGFAACFAEPSDLGSPVPGAAGSSTNESGGSAGEAGQSTGPESGGSGGSGGGSGGVPNGTGGSSGAAGDDDPGTVEPFVCSDPLAEPLPARRAITSGIKDPPGGGPEIITITREQLFREFENRGCGDSGCHGGADKPNARSPDAYRVTLKSFDQRPNIGTEALERVTSSDLDLVMPRGSGDGSKRGPTNPFVRLAQRLLAWQEAGFPDVLELTAEGKPVDPSLPKDPYALPPALGGKLSNLGSCIPKRTAMLAKADDEIRQKDALFASLGSSEELPDTIVETDLVSLDSVQLARRRIFSYAPTYPLFSDHAGKMRHVRVPEGKTIRYNPETRDFDIPDNTRFYKTFLKDVKDKDGIIGHRKMETRLIVVRRDEKLADGSFVPRALRATYAWDKDETIAQRVKDPFRDGSEGADRLCPLVVDESMTRDPAVNPISQDISEFCTYMTEEERNDPSSGKIRHYAIPSSQRCDQCHMGSNNRSYILGFSPWQVDRRKDGEGGVYEAPKPDELSQLARLIEYGVITGIEPGQAKLEESQGARKPRNDYELKAQAYMIGNCAFCHNPNGFPVVQNPVLREFEMYPNETTGGIFEFSLERYSPRTKGAKDQSTRVPYITPAFGDFGFIVEGTDNHNQRELARRDGVYPLVDAADFPPDYDPIDSMFTFLGPWRSLIWRNVYTPFTYQEKGTIFVHMPRNVAGFDCRAQTIMAEWMLSIPSIPKPPNLEQRSYDQPFMELDKLSSRQLNPREYRAALAATNKRLRDYRFSATGSWCPDDDDIVDARVINSPVDIETAKPLFSSPPDEGLTGERLVSEYPVPLIDFVPDHAHWVPTDTTDPAERWSPRRPNWKELIATRELPPPAELGPMIDQLQTIHVSPELEPFALEPLPMGTWHTSCQSRPEISGEPFVSEVRADPNADLPRWLAGGVFTAEPAVEERRVHSQSRGEAVFRAICQNCHGRAADSKSPLAATILELTGGKTRVANFLSGLFGPPGAAGAFAREEFTVGLGATPEDWQARYLLFMGLGGTSADIPQVVLNLVATSPFYDSATTAPGGDSPNMLGSAQNLCDRVLRSQRKLSNRAPPAPLLFWPADFVRNTGHYELWEAICGFQNETIVHVFVPAFDGTGPTSGPEYVYRVKDDNGMLLYPEDRPVGNQRGEIQLGIQPENLRPWCLRVNGAADGESLREWAALIGLPEAGLPICPEPLFAEALGMPIHKLALDDNGSAPGVPFGNQAFTDHWLRRGAMNAGLVAFKYLQGLTSGTVQPARPFNFCLE
jgi:hypothetical protein